MILALLPKFMEFKVQKILPVLWFAGNGKEAMEYYVDIFPNSTARVISTYPKGAMLPEGEMMVGQIDAGGLKFGILNATPHDSFNDAVSFLLPCENQAEIDYYWNAFTKEGKEVMCGWCKDKYGVSWQIVPKMWMDLVENGTPEQNQNGMGAIMKMKKIIISEIEKAIS